MLPRGVRFDVLAALSLWVVALFLSAFVWAHGVGFVGSDEMYGFVQSNAAHETGHHAAAVPYADVARGAFVPMGVSGSDVIDSGVSPVFAYTLSPFAASPLASAFGMIAISVMLLAALYVVARVSSAGVVGLVALVALALSPPFLFWSTLFYANVPAVAFFVVSFAFIVLYARSNNLAWLIGSAAVLVLAAAMRRDSITLIAPFMLIVGVYATRRPILWFFLATAAYASISAFAFGIGLGDNVFGAAPKSWDDLMAVRRAVERRYEGYHPEQSWAIFEANVRTFTVGLYPVLAFVGGLGAWLFKPTRRGFAWAIATFFALGVTLAVVSFTSAPFAQDPRGVFSSYVRYAFLLPVCFALGVGALVARVVPTFPARTRAVVGVVLVLAIVTPGLAQAFTDDDGFRWLGEARDHRSGVNAAADDLPPNAYLVGDELSKFVTTRAVLVPQKLGDRDVAVPKLIDKLAATKNATAYAHESSYWGDWGGMVGEHVTDAHHHVVPSDVPGFFEVRRTNTTLANVSILGAGEWRANATGFLHSQRDYSTFSATPRVANMMQQVPSPAFLATIVVADNDGAWHEAGIVGTPQEANSIQVLQRWLGAGSGSLRAIEIFIPAGNIGHVYFYVSAGLDVHSITIQPLAGVTSQ